MAHSSELSRFRRIWNAEAESAARVMEAVPEDQYDLAMRALQERM